MSSSNAYDNPAYLDLLLRLGDAIRSALTSASPENQDNLSSVTRESAADVIYGIDAAVEDVTLNWLDQNWPAESPVELVMEGIDERLAFPRGSDLAATGFKLILDPIDGTRGLMYDKRSAWFLAGLARQRNDATGLQDIFVAAMTELPTRKQGKADQIGAIRGKGLSSRRINLLDRQEEPFTPQPSQARDLAHGFASCAKFFPYAKAKLAAFEEELLRECVGSDLFDTASVFDDQYLSTGGQLYELMAGHDRLTMDLRPLAFRSLGDVASLSCHPYDICCELVAREAGVVIQTPDGKPLDAPLDLTTPVTWVGFANAELARSIGPIIDRLTRKHFSN